MPYLLIDLGEENVPAERYLVARTVLKATVDFWMEFFATHGIVDDAEPN
jgi:hypothetical protein